MRSFLLLLSLVSAAGLACAQTDVYRWVDQDGKVHFSDTPPPQASKDVTQKRMGGGAVESGLPYATQMAMKKSPVTLYATRNCAEGGTDLCDRGRSLLAGRGIPYAEKDPLTNPADAEQLKKLAGSMMVPVLVVGAEAVTGYDEASWTRALDAAGYPRTRLPSSAEATATK